jgi:Predicted esterase
MPPVHGPNLHYKTFDSPTAGAKVSYLVYLPPHYEEETDRRYPVIYWLHGIGGSQQGVPLMAERLTAAISAGKAPPMIVIYLNGMIRSSYVDSADGTMPVETVSIRELIPHIDATYRTIPTREGRMVEGFSMGGAGAVKWGFKYPELFGSISIIDGALHAADRPPTGRMAESFRTIHGGDMERFIASQPQTLAEKNATLVQGRTAIRIVTRTTGLAAANERFHELLDRLGIEHEFYKIPDAPHSPNPLYEGLGERNWPFYRKAFAAAPPSAHAAAHPRPPREPAAGLLYYAKADYAFADNSHVIANPHIIGALFQVIWSEVEKEDGRYDWSELDRWIEPWITAGKKVAIRIMWSTSGAWPRPYYKTPTPRWVWEKGASFAFHQPTGTEIPLIWDPIYRKYAWRFLERFADRYDANPNILFFDITPGAETNPYRFGTINRTDPSFKDTFEKTTTSDGRAYDEELWIQNIKEWVDASDRIFKQTPLLVTLNVGGLRSRDRLIEIGDYCASRGFYIGQNGLGGNSYRDPESGRTEAFLRWAGETKTFFEMVQRSGGRTGTLMEVMLAAARVRCHYLNVYPEDVREGTRGEPDFDPASEAALAFGAQALAQSASTHRIE